MAIYRARLGREADGTWIAAAIELPHCWSRGGSADEALARLRDEVRYRIEFCPCSGVPDDFVTLEVVGGDADGAPGSTAPRRLPAVFRGVAGCPAEPEQPQASLPPEAPAPAVRPTAAPRAGWKRWDD
jgi:hypothetical protein